MIHMKIALIAQNQESKAKPKTKIMPLKSEAKWAYSYDFWEMSTMTLMISLWSMKYKDKKMKRWMPRADKA